MAEPVKTSISISKTHFDQAELLAQQFDISPSQLFEMALEKFISDSSNQMLPDDERSNSQEVKLAAPNGAGQAIINQGDIYWLQLDDASGLEAGIAHPHVVVQENVFNHSRIHSVVVCALTSNIKRASIHGNVVLEVGEANLPKPSVVEASKVSTVNKMQ